MPPKLTRTVRVTCWIVAMLLVSWLAFIQGPNWLTRWRMTRLLADFHSIQLNQSTWPDAQRLMARWGKWGHYVGTCSATDCTYTIAVSDPYSVLLARLSERAQEHLFNSNIPRIASRLGWRYSSFFVRFAVQDNTIVWTNTTFNVPVADSGPPEHWSYQLGIRTQVREQLNSERPSPGEPSILGSDEQLDNHPDYKVGRPSGCEGCEDIEVTYTVNLSKADVLRLTDINLACLTRLHACTMPGDLLAPARDWHLYEDRPDNLYGSIESGPVPCRTELRALGRDAGILLEVEPFAVSTRKDTDDPSTPLLIETAQVHLLRVIKGEIPAKPGSTLLVSTFPGSPATLGEPAFSPEHLSPQHRYFVRIESSYAYAAGALVEIPPLAPMTTQRCGVIDDTPANLAALQLGIAQDIPYRHPPTFGQ